MIATAQCPVDGATIPDRWRTDRKWECPHCRKVFDAHEVFDT